jgi:uncharacterized GH25 family protein
MKGGNMKKLFALVVLSLCVSAPSFAAEHVVSHSAKVAGKDSYKAAKFSAKETGKTGKKLVYLVF